MIHTVIPAVFLGLFVLLPSLAGAAEWRCRNSDMEITCISGKCSPSDGFTPMDVTFSDKGAMSICAYSGCWEGKGKLLTSGDHLLLSGHKLQWTGTIPETGDFLIALDKSSGIATINGCGFAMPLACRHGIAGKVLPSENKITKE